MFDIGIQELIVIFVVALLVFGPNRLPELARNLGKGVAHLKSAMADIKGEMDKEINASKYVLKEYEIPSMKGDSFTLKTGEGKTAQAPATDKPESTPEAPAAPKDEAARPSETGSDPSDSKGSAA